MVYFRHRSFCCAARTGAQVTVLDYVEHRLCQHSTSATYCIHGRRTVTSHRALTLGQGGNDARRPRTSEYYRSALRR
ncbi:hypothetical protein AMELA_G00242070 [Ameiurus melas]|uniref:Uncharacterized protein n=1 Tax=Ameiurus melas TaxID=219545 RepID=A0A7J5ZW78_AMEME|nr:hypothetical protein AMELA_G00242070 [Ameiurus melas]